MLVIRLENEEFPGFSINIEPYRQRQFDTPYWFSEVTIPIDPEEARALTFELRRLSGPVTLI
jgi:hypothetical protein